MEREEVDDTGSAYVSGSDNQALNPTILDYYKKFGRKRDLEQYFSLSTAQGEVKDPTSLFWRRMKSQTDSSDSGEKSRESSLEVCRISIRCSAPDDAPSSQDENQKTKSDTESPPIIIEEVPLETSRHTDDEYAKSDDNNSQKSLDAMLDTSMIKALSPSSSITSQRKLEWDSLADVGYANESDKRTSASSLSTLERLALKQQYSNNDTKDENVMGVPTAHSTPVDENDKPKGKKSSKTTKIYRRDVEFVEFNMPHSSNVNPTQSINVNLTKHISFNVEKGGGVTVENVKKDVSVSPEKASTESKVTDVKMDKEIQTSLIKTKDESVEAPKSFQLYGQAVPVLINLNTLKKRNRKKKLRTVKKKVRSRKKSNVDKENFPVHEKSGEQVSEAESFEYMPGHIYNQNQLNQQPQPARTSQPAGNKSSLESSGAATTDSSKGSKLSFSKDLEKSIKLLKTALHKRYNDTELKDKLIKDVVERLLKSSYKDDETTTDFLSGLSYSSKKLGLGASNTTTSTSDANNTAEKTKRPKKSILRVDKFNPNAIASTSQSAPNIPSVSNSEKLVSSRLAKALTSSNTESDVSSKEKTSPDTAFAKTSSEELYQKYLDALRRENAYKKHLRDKELFLKQKLVSSDTAFNMPVRLDPKSQSRIKELMNDLTRNNYDDGSGDASKLEGGLGSNLDLRYGVPRSQRSHSVFTLSSSGNSDPNRKSNLKKSEMKDSPKAGHSREEKHYCCCPHHNKMGVTDSSVQVNMKCGSEKSSPRQEKESKPCSCGQICRQSSPRPITRIVSDNSTGDIKYVCLCNNNVAEIKGSSDNVMIYKCSRLTNKGIQSQCAPSQRPDKCPARSRNACDHSNFAKFSKCSQTNLKVVNPEPIDEVREVCIHEAVRVIQTDISIDPKISDPVISDIKIVKPCDCVKLVREQYRQVSKCSIASDANAQLDYNMLTSCPCSEASVAVATPSTSSFCSKAKGDKSRDNRIMMKETVDAEIQSTIDIPTAEVPTSEDNYTIPIQGTNIVLKVSVGPNAVRVLETLENVDRSSPMATANPVEHDIVSVITRNSNAVVTDAIGTAENATCLSEECSKGVQSQNDDIFSQYDTRQSLLRALFTSDEYPNLQSTSAVNSRRPLLRARTSTCIVNSAQQDLSAVPSQQQKSMETMTERSNSYPKSQDVQFNRQKLPSSIVHQIPMGVFRFQGPEGATYDKLYMEDRESYAVIPEPKPNRNIEKQTQSTCCNVATSQSDIEEITEPVKRRTVDCMTVAPIKSAFMKYSSENDSDQYGVSAGESSYDLYPNIGAQESKKSKCGCSTDGPCKGECGEGAACRNQKSTRTGPEIPLQTIEERSYSEDTSEPQVLKATCNPYDNSSKKSVLCGPDQSASTSALRDVHSSNEATGIRDQGCGCAISGPCRGECGDNAACRKQKLDCFKGVPLVKQHASTEIYSSDEYPELAALRADVYYTKEGAETPQTTTKQTSCGCATSGPCKGECGENAACRKRKVDNCHDPLHFTSIGSESVEVAYRPNENAEPQTSTNPLYRQSVDEDSHNANKYPFSFSAKKGHFPDDDKEAQKQGKRRASEIYSSNEYPEFAALRDAYCPKEGAETHQETSCGCAPSGPCKGECGEDAACRKRRLDGSQDLSHFPSTCSESVEIAYHQFEDSDTRGDDLSFKIQTGSDPVHRQPVDEDRRYSYSYSVKRGNFPDDDKQTQKSCGCATSDPCNGQCGDVCKCKRKTSDNKPEEKSQRQISDLSDTGNYDTRYSRESTYPSNEPTEFSKKKSCGCSTYEPCKGLCGDVCACKRKTSDNLTEEKLQEQMTDGSDIGKGDVRIQRMSQKPTELSKKKSCGCSTSGPCKGQCEVCACERKTSDDVAEEKSQEQTSYGSDIGRHFSQQFPHNESDNRSQTLPKRGPPVVKDHTLKTLRSQSLTQKTITGVHGSQNTVTEKKESESIETEEKDIEVQKKPKPTNEKSENSKDLIMNVIQDITNRYSKKYIEKNQRKKCFKEIISLLSYLLDTEDSTDTETIREIKNMITASSSSDFDIASQLRKDKVDNEDAGSEYENRRRPRSPRSRPKSPKPRPSSPTCTSKPSKSRPTSPACAIPPRSRSTSPKSRPTSPKCQPTSPKCRPTSPKYRPRSPKPRSKSPKSRPKSPTRKEMKSVGSYVNTGDGFITSSNSYYHETKRLVHKGIQISTKKSKSSKFHTESSDVPISTDIPYTSSDSATCKVLNKIRKECEKYHQKRCKAQHNATKKCECTSTTSLSCDQCKRMHHCMCRTHKCKGHRPKSVCEKPKKKCVAYNLIIQTSESMISEESKLDKNARPLKNIIVKVPPKRRPVDDVPHKLLNSPRPTVKGQRSRSLPNENYVSSTDDGVKTQVFTVRDYLERNRPDFVDQTMQRQNCLKLISEARANERAIQRELLSMQVQMDGEPSLKSLSETDLRRLARKLGLDLRHRQVPPKFISEHDMKKHSEKIYKNLPEVVKKKEDIKKENIKKTNLLMANIFKKNLQKKVLHGAVNLSNYSTVIKI